MITILGIILIFTSLIGILGSFYRERRAIHILYTTLVLVALIYQISIAVIVYDQAAHTEMWLGDAWNESTKQYKLFAQTKVIIQIDPSAYILLIIITDLLLLLLWFSLIAVDILILLIMLSLQQPVCQIIML